MFWWQDRKRIMESLIPTDEPLRQEYFMSEVNDIIHTGAIDRGKYPTYKVVTFGCQMNARDSEKLSGILSGIGYTEAKSEEDADLVLFNTCTVRENANDRLYGRVGQLKKSKEKNPDMIIGICGCMMQEAEEVEKIKKSYRHVDLVFGTHNIYKLAEILFDHLKTKKQIVDVMESADIIVEKLPNKRQYAFKSGVNITFGCNNFCSYCIVPYVRGRERSRKPEEITDEIKDLVADGVKEVMLLGQNVNSYGKGLDEKTNFAMLLDEVAKIDGLERLRFMTPHPKDLSDEVIEVMKNNKKICKHLHLPLQSGSSAILKKMNRVYTKDTLEVVKEVRYDSAFTFIYSKRSGTPAAKMEEQVDSKAIKDRFDRLLKTVQDIAAENTKKNEGKCMPVLVENNDEHLEGYLTGKLENNLTVHFKGGKRLIGEIVDVVLDEAKGFYYMGHIQTSEE